LQDQTEKSGRSETVNGKVNEKAWNNKHERSSKIVKKKGCMEPLKRVSLIWVKSLGDRERWGDLEKRRNSWRMAGGEKKRLCLMFAGKSKKKITAESQRKKGWLVEGTCGQGGGGGLTRLGGENWGGWGPEMIRNQIWGWDRGDRQSVRKGGLFNSITGEKGRIRVKERRRWNLFPRRYPKPPFGGKKSELGISIWASYEGITREEH